jgi:hypothetical protein
MTHRKNFVLKTLNTQFGDIRTFGDNGTGSILAKKMNWRRFSRRYWQIRRYWASTCTLFFHTHIF